VNNLFLLSGLSVALFLFLGPAIRNLLSRVINPKVEATDMRSFCETDIWSLDDPVSNNVDAGSRDEWILN
jgi:hypothetical protein